MAKNTARGVCFLLGFSIYLFSAQSVIVFGFYNGTSNYSYYCCINNTTAVWNLKILAPPPVNIALIPHQHVIHQASKYQSRYCIADIDDNTSTMLLQPGC